MTSLCRHRVRPRRLPVQQDAEASALQKRCKLALDPSRFCSGFTTPRASLRRLLIAVMSLS